MPNFAKLFVGTENPDGVDVNKIAGGTPIPSLNTISMTPGTYIYNGESFDCSRQGLYRFRPVDANGNPTNSRMHNKICWSPGANFDIYSVMSAISWNHVHGRADEHYDFQATANASTYRVMRSTCGHISAWCQWFLSFAGIQTRIVNVTTLGPLNGWDDGHIVIETFTNGKWRMWDHTTGRYFVDVNGGHMSTAQFVAAIANGGQMPDHVMMAADKLWNHEAEGELDFGLHRQFFRSSPEHIEKWYRRIFQAIV